MKTKNTYQQPIDLNKITKVAKDGIAHVGDLIYSIDYDAPEGTEVLAALDGVVIGIKNDSNTGGLEKNLRRMVIILKFYMRTTRCLNTNIYGFNLPK